MTQEIVRSRLEAFMPAGASVPPWRAVRIDESFRPVVASCTDAWEQCFVAGVSLSKAKKGELLRILNYGAVETEAPLPRTGERLFLGLRGRLITWKQLERLRRKNRNVRLVDIGMVGPGGILHVNIQPPHHSANERRKWKSKEKP